MKSQGHAGKRWIALALALALATPWAQAGAPVLQKRGETASRVSAPRHAVQTPRHGSSARNRGNAFGPGNYPILEALRDSYEHRRYDGRHRSSYERDTHDSSAVKAAAIAAAVIGVAGILANAQAQPCPATAVVALPPPPPPPAPVPRGYFATERVLVQPGHYEQVQVWIPETRDPYTGRPSGGYHEVRQRWIPDVYEYRPVWVAE